MILRYIYWLGGIVACIGLLFYGIYQIYFYYQEKPEVNIALPSISLVPDQTRMLVPIPHGYNPEAALLPPKPLYYYSYSRQWQVYPLTSEQESIKENALNEFVSQLRVPIMSGLLRSFIRKNELFEEVDIPAVVSQTSDLELAEINNWVNQQPILV